MSKFKFFPGIDRALSETPLIPTYQWRIWTSNLKNLYWPASPIDASETLLKVHALMALQGFLGRMFDQLGTIETEIE